VQKAYLERNQKVQWLLAYSSNKQTFWTKPYPLNNSNKLWLKLDRTTEAGSVE